MSEETEFSVPSDNSEAKFYENTNLPRESNFKISIPTKNSLHQTENYLLEKSDPKIFWTPKLNEEQQKVRELRIMMPSQSSRIYIERRGDKPQNLHNTELSNLSVSNQSNEATSSPTTFSNINFSSSSFSPFLFTTEKVLPIKGTKRLSLTTTEVEKPEEKEKENKLNDMIKGALSFENAEPALQMYIKLLAVSNISKVQKMKLLSSILKSIEKAWAQPLMGRNLAYKLCDVLRESGGIDLILGHLSKIKKKKISSQAIPVTHTTELVQPLGDTRRKSIEPPTPPTPNPDRDILLESASVLAQSMTVPNRDYVARMDGGLDTIVATADQYRDDSEMMKASLGILECLFKHTDNTCKRLIKCGGLDSVLYACRHLDASVLRPCAVALANLALYGDEECQESMIIRKAPEWLFPLAFSKDDKVKYYAFIAIAALGANKQLESSVLKSGTLSLIEPFLQNKDPLLFGISHSDHMHGHSEEWLEKLTPLLFSKRAEVQSLAAFHFAMETEIKSKQGNLEMFKRLNVVERLKTLALSEVKLASKFATQAMETLGALTSDFLHPQIIFWTTEDLCDWMQGNGILPSAVEKFREDKMDVDLMLQLTEEDLKRDYGMERAVERKRFLRQVTKLKTLASYVSCDTVSKEVEEFLGNISPDFKQYTYQMSKAGTTISSLKSLTEDHLIKDCGIFNGIHRLRILEAAGNLEDHLFSRGEVHLNQENGRPEKSLDVFISYRRSNGSQLASLLKVHLQLRGYSVFLDIERLSAGKFDEGLLQSIQSSKNFILVLTPNALDRCIGDEGGKDWIHREIVAALNGNCNIVPIIDDFQFPSLDLLPLDIQTIARFNGIKWIHDYQDACVDKLEQFINCPVNSPKRQALGWRKTPSKGNSLNSDLQSSLEIFNPPDESRKGETNVSTIFTDDSPSSPRPPLKETSIYQSTELDQAEYFEE